MVNFETEQITLLRSNEITGIEDFAPHDLRRSAASIMTGKGIPRLVVKKVLNHVESDITAVYDRHSYDGEKQQALNVWALILDRIITGKEDKAVVIPILSKQA